MSSSAGHHFSETRWSMVLAAAAQGEAALAALCRAYWFPLYAFIRRQGASPHDAEDLTQGFFAHLLAKDALSGVGREKGRFRTFLLVSLKHFLADARDHANAQKRGSGQAALSLDGCAAEERYALEPLDELSPDRLFDRRWALAVIEQALARLAAEYAVGRKGALFAELKPLLTTGGGARSCAEIGASLGISEGAVKVAAHRLRQHYGAALRAEIAETVGSEAEIYAELRHLRDALNS